MLRLLLIIFLAAEAFAQDKPLKDVTVLVEGDSSVISKFINVCRQMGPERGLNFKFVDKMSDQYDYRVVWSSEGSSMWDWAHGTSS
jgi:hypothetical protein